VAGAETTAAYDRSSEATLYAAAGSPVVCMIDSPAQRLEDFATSLSDGTLAFQLRRLAEMLAAAVALGGRYSRLLKLQHSRGPWLADVLTRLHLRDLEVQMIYADSRKFAEDCTCPFLAAALRGASRRGQVKG
jgi:hypothetical protein